MSEKLRVLDLFSGIGGFSLGLEQTGGFKTVAFCEIDEFCRRVLAKHWPDVPIYEDVRTFVGVECDVICGGFPCQDISLAGRGAGINGERSGLWKEFASLIGKLRPRYVIVENSAAINIRGLLRVLGDLAEVGYDAEWHCIPASCVGASHVRDRTWIVAYPNRDKWNARRWETGTVVEKASHQFRGCPGRAPTPRISRGSDGIPNRLDRLRGCGNAVFPKIPEIIGRAILEAEKQA